jgi:UDP:flavonoid glycosyltransferase YjiC (YdhE family)
MCLLRRVEPHWTVRSARLLLAVIDGGGTVPPAMGVARELVRRGHRVRVLGDPTIARSALAAGCTFTAWTTAPHFDTVADQTATLAAAENGSPRQRVGAARRLLGSGATRGFADDVLAAVRAEPVEGVLAEAAMPGILIGAEASGLPCAALMPNIYLRPTPGLPPLGTGWSPGTGPLGRARDAVAVRVVGGLASAAARPLNRVRADHGLPPIDGLFALLDRCTRVLVLTSPTFDFPAARLPANVRYVGPQLDDPDWAAGADWRPDGPGPLVLVAMSSVYQNQVETLRTVAAALGPLPVRAVITTGRAVDPDDVPAPAHVRVVRSAPHGAVLAEASAVVTHAGHGTVLKSLAAGVPLVCVPMGRDQRDNSTRVVRLGAGVRVPRSADAGRIGAAVREVLDAPGYAAAARRFAQVLATEAATRPSAADEVEAMVTASRG